MPNFTPCDSGFVSGVGSLMQCMISGATFAECNMLMVELGLMVMTLYPCVLRVTLVLVLLLWLEAFLQVVVC